MNRKLLFLDVALVAVLAYAGVQFHAMYRAAKKREADQLGKKVPPVPAPKFPAAVTPPAVMATNYLDIPQKDLLDKSRNSTVVVEPPPPPPPPPPMPALPIYHGQMNLGDGQGLFALLSVDSKAPHEAIHRGEAIGQFKLLDVNREGIDFEWNGQTVHRNLYELVDRSAPQQQAETPAQRPAVAAAPAAPQPQTAKGPGDATPAGVRVCQPNDSYPTGAVVDGFRKMSRPTPFGAMCYWEPVGGTAGR